VTQESTSTRGGSFSLYEDEDRARAHFPIDEDQNEFDAGHERPMGEFPWRMNVMGDWRTHDHARLTTEVQQAVDKYLKSAVRLVCFSEDQPDEHPEFGIDEYGREDLIKGWEHDRMWAQYAENHTGICLFFDRDKLHRRMEEHFSGGGTLVHGAMAYLITA
jgi:hypothetical protein